MIFFVFDNLCYNYYDAYVMVRKLQQLHYVHCVLVRTLTFFVVVVQLCLVNVSSRSDIDRLSFSEDHTYGLNASFGVKCLPIKKVGGLVSSVCLCAIFRSGALLIHLASHHSSSDSPEGHSARPGRRNSARDACALIH